MAPLSMEPLHVHDGEDSAPAASLPALRSPVAHSRATHPGLARLDIDAANYPHIASTDILRRASSGHQLELDGPVADPNLHHSYLPASTHHTSDFAMEKYYSIDATSHRTDEAREQRHRDAVNKDVSAFLTLGFIMPFVSLPICLYSLLILLGVTFAAPIFLPLWGKDALARRYKELLFPGLNLHFRMARSSRRCAADSAPRTWPGTASPQSPVSPVSSSSSVNGEKMLPSPSVGHLAKVLVLSPFPAFAVMIANIVIGVFWPLSALTEGAGTTSSMDDGRLMAKRVRRTWVHWLAGELARKGHLSQRRRSQQPCSV